MITYRVWLGISNCEWLIESDTRRRHLGTWTGRRDRALLTLAVQAGLRISELISLTTTDVHLGAGPHVNCTGKGRRHRATPLTPTSVTVLTAYLAERALRPGDALFPGPNGQHLSRDALEHRLAVHLATAAVTCPSLVGKHITMHDALKVLQGVWRLSGHPLNHPQAQLF